MGFGRTYFRAAPTTPRLAFSLQLLARAVDLRWPNRDTGSDGWLGDQFHAQRLSQHNPDDQGIVRALDVTSAGIRPRLVVAAAINHSSVWYVIHSRTIWSSTYNYAPRPYAGPDPHYSHVHVSIHSTARAAASRKGWHFP